MKAFHNFSNMQNFTKSINKWIAWIIAVDSSHFLHLAMLCCSSILFYLNVFVFCTFWSLHFARFVCLLLTFSPLFCILLQIHYIMISNSTSLLHWIPVFHTYETLLILKRNKHFSTFHWSRVAWIWSFRKDIF